MNLTRRTLLQTAALSAVRAEGANWKPKVGIYCKYSPANVAFAGKEGFTCMQIAVGGGLPADATDEQLGEVKGNLQLAGITVTALGGPGNHFDPKFQSSFVKSI